MTQFHNGQQVEVRAKTHMSVESRQWVKGTIVIASAFSSLVEFEDGLGRVFLNEDIRDPTDISPSTSMHASRSARNGVGLGNGPRTP